MSEDQANQSPSQSQLTSTPNMQTLAAMSAPLTILIGANAYFSGFVYRAFVGEYYGLSSSFLEDSVQVTMARGFAANLLLLAVTAVFIIITFTLQLVASFLLKRFFPSFVTKVKKGIVDKFRSVRRQVKLYNIAHLTVIIITFGLCSGSLVSFIKILDAEATILNRCGRCFLYTVKQGQFVGVPIGQDGKQSVIRTRTGIRIVKNEDLKTIRFITLISPFRAGVFMSAPWYR